MSDAYIQERWDDDGEIPDEADYTKIDYTT